MLDLFPLVSHSHLPTATYGCLFLRFTATVSSTRNLCGLNWSFIFSSGTLVSTATAEEAPPAEETDAQPVKRAAEEEEVGCRLASQYTLLITFWILCLIWINTYLPSFLLFPIRKMWRQKSKRQRKTATLKKQKWRLRSLTCSFCGTVLPAWSTSCCRACAFCTFWEIILFCLLPCYHLALESWKMVALHLFFCFLFFL